MLVSWGAVLIGFKATGITIPNHNRIGKTFLPNEDYKEIYEQRFEKFKRVYLLIKAL